MNRDYLIHIAKRYPVEAIVVRHLYEDGLDTEEKLCAYLDTQRMNDKVRNKLVNAYRDIYQDNVYVIKAIPQLKLTNEHNESIH